MKFRTQLITHKETFVICPIAVLSSSHLTTTGDRTTNKPNRLPSLYIFPEGTNLERNISPRRGGDVDCLLHPPLLSLHLQTLAKEAESQKDLNILTRKEIRSTSSSSSSWSVNQSHDYGIYKRSRHSLQAAENLSMLQPAAITKVQTILQPEHSMLQPAEITYVQTIPQPEHTLQRSTKDSGSDSESRPPSETYKTYNNL